MKRSDKSIEVEVLVLNNAPLRGETCPTETSWTEMFAFWVCGLKKLFKAFRKKLVGPYKYGKEFKRIIKAQNESKKEVCIERVGALWFDLQSNTPSSFFTWQFNKFQVTTAIS